MNCAVRRPGRAGTNLPSSRQGCDLMTGEVEDAYVAFADPRARPWQKQSCARPATSLAVPPARRPQEEAAADCHPPEGTIHACSRPSGDGAVNAIWLPSGDHATDSGCKGGLVS